MIRRFGWKLILFFCIGLSISFGFVGFVQSQNQNSLVDQQLQEQKVCIESLLEDSQAESTEIVKNFAIRRQSDSLIKKGEPLQAAKLLETISKTLPKGTAALIPPTRDVEKLPNAAQVYWRNGEAGLNNDLESQALVSLGNLSENYPEFMPGHIKFAEASLRWNQPEKAINTLDRAYEFYPDRIDILAPLLKLLIAKKMNVEASIAARQFALNYPEHPDAAKYKKLSEEYINQFLDEFNKNAIVTLVLSGDRKLFDLVSKGESGFGAAVAEENKQSPNSVSSAKFLEYLNNLGKKLAKFAGRDEFKYEFYVVRDKSLNAFALPGGKIFINTGTIANLESEAELAGILSHEIAHAVFSHSYLKSITDVQAGALRKFGVIGSVLDLVKPEIAFSRSLEKQADLLGTRILASAGYSSDGLYRVFERWSKYEKKSGTNWLDTHPATSERLQYLAEIINNRNYNRYSIENVEALAEARIQLCNDEKIAKAALSPTPNASTTPQPSTNALNDPKAIATANRGNTDTKTGNSESKNPSSSMTPVPSASSKPVATNEPMIGALTRDNVSIILRDVKVNPVGNFAINIEIINNSKSDFGFVPAFVKVLNADGKALKNAFTTKKDKPLVASGETVKANIVIRGQAWRPNAKQDLILEIIEGTIGGRVFRIAF